MTLHTASSLDSSQKEKIQTMVTACTVHDGTSLSFPFEDACLFLFSEQDDLVTSAIGFVPVDDMLYECSAFTHPDCRDQELFSSLLEAGLSELPEDSELLFYADKKAEGTFAVLDSIGAEPDSEEHMMELSPEDFSSSVSVSGSARLLSDLSVRFSEVSGTPTLTFLSSHAVVHFSVFPSHDYLYGFEVAEDFRGAGYGTAFLSCVLTVLFSGKYPTGSTGETANFDTMHHRSPSKPVLLQVSGDNLPALSLYKKTGFRITETLCCYLY